MNRYDWIMWAFRLIFSSDVIEAVKKMVSQAEANTNQDGMAKRDFVEQAIKPMASTVSIYFLRALIELVLGRLREKSSRA